MNAEAAELLDDLDDAPIVDAPGAAAAPAKKRKNKTSPTQRTLKYLRKNGCQLVAITEHWNAWAGIRQDLFGIIDVLAIKDKTVIAVQTTSTGVSGRIDKIVEATFKNPETKETHRVLPALLGAGIKVYVHGWRKNSLGKWILREVELS